MKKTLLFLLLLVLVGIAVYLGWDKIMPTAQPQTQLPASGSVADIINANSGILNQTGTETVVTGAIGGMDYQGGGEYKPYLPQSAKDALLADKNVILFFYANWDPTDQSLDKDIQEKTARIPKDYVIFRVDYDGNENLRNVFSITEQNTVVFLDKDGKEYARRAVGITQLSQIVRAIKNLDENVK